MAKLDLNGLSVQDLNDELQKLEAQYHALQYSNATATLTNTSEIKEVRRNIARVKTAIRSKELVDSTQKRDKIQARRRMAKKIKK